MKSIILAALIAFPPLGFGQVWLNQGESQLFEFQSQSAIPPEELFVTTLGLRFAPGTFTLGEDATVEVFRNALADTPFTFGIVSLIDPSDTTTSLDGGVSWYEDNSPLWPDLQCLVRITMNNGDAQLEGFSLHITRASDFSIYHEFVAVPEPASFALIVVGVGCAKLFGRRLRR